MYLLKNSLKNIGRNAGRNLLIGIILFVIIGATAVAILINTATKAIIDDYRTRFGSEVTLSLDYGKAIDGGAYTDTGENGLAVTDITPAMQLEFAKSPYLKETRMTSSTMANVPGLKVMEDSNDNIYRVWLNGSNTPTISADFINGKRKIIDGDIYKNENDCLISKQIADKNELKIGDTLLLKRGSSEYTLTICGIFEDHTMDGVTRHPLEAVNPLNNSNNEILTAMETAEKIGVESLAATYYLKDPSTLDKFKADLLNKGLPGYYNVKTDEAGYKAVVGPMENMQGITNTFMIVVLAVGAVILLLVSAMAARERKYEIGVLRAMGMSKGKVVTGFAVEMLLITVVCLGIGLGLSALIAQPIGNSLLQSQIELAQEAAKNGLVTVTTIDTGALAAAAASTVTALSEIKIALSGMAALEISLVAIGLAIASSLIGIIRIMRYEPMRILSERG
ncbi:MAG: ABC transporter permease [Christensenellaceae bacterium]|jgi:putative ABC transport system permease protein|nr:ABC transporter permease [Christensenellaceae bacterium]